MARTPDRHASAPAASVPAPAPASVPAPASARRRHALPRRGLLVSAAAAGIGAAGLSFTVGPGGARGVATAAAPPVSRTAPGALRLRGRAPAPGPFRAGTTLDRTSAPKGSGTYRRLADGPGWGRVVREDLVGASAGREDRRRVLASFVQFTDLHVVDVQHPLRYEYLRAQTASAWRPQEALSVPGVVSLIERVNALPGAPATGAPLDFVMTTGDNTDNNCTAELEWFLTAMTGGRITPNTGDPRRYEGVQNSGERTYWHPDDDLRDADKALGFPRLDAYLEAAIREVTSPGLNLPWYATVGNHDVLPGGCYAAGDAFLTDVAVGDRKLYALPEAQGAALWARVKEGGDPLGEDFTALLRSHARRTREVTPDPRRAPYTPRGYVAAHLDPRFLGAGPAGHGYSQADLAEGRMYYTFRMADDVLGVSLDTTRRGGHYTGLLEETQLRWLEKQLKDNPNDHVLLFSHHTAKTTDGSEALLALAREHGNVLAWINGHSHRNKVTAHEGGLWEVSTASHIDFPQLARVLELTDNGDGTLSLFTTLIESAAPSAADHTDLSQTGLASLYRELAFNAPGRRTALTGTPGDRNTELLLRRR